VTAAPDASGDDSGDASGGTDGGLTGGDTASEGSGGDDGDNGGFAVPSVGGAAFGADTVGSPGSISPPFPFVSLLRVRLFLVPMNFLIRRTARRSVLDERTNRRGEPLLVTPLSPVDIVAGRRSRTSRSRRSSRRSSQSPSAAGRSR